ncbi:hypothetical protein AKO1_001274 [Acrasis kona]|uniref:Uncharacterized protein n=1 Tax=Acrasis kona TaxID=1008807 RepID=A0AAW2ZAS5_9EUKA
MLELHSYWPQFFCGTCGMEEHPFPLHMHLKNAGTFHYVKHKHQMDFIHQTYGLDEQLSLDRYCLSPEEQVGGESYVDDDVVYYHYEKKSLEVDGLQSVRQVVGPEQIAVLVASHAQTVDFNTVVDQVHIMFPTNTLIESQDLMCEEDTSILSSIHSLLNGNSRLWDMALEWFFISKEGACLNFRSLGRVLGSVLTLNKPVIVSGDTSIEALTKNNDCKVPIGSGFVVNRLWLNMYKAIVCNYGDCSKFDVDKIHLMFSKEMFWVRHGVILEHIPTWYCGSLNAMEHPDARYAIDHRNVASFNQENTLGEHECVDCTHTLSKSGFFEYYGGEFHNIAYSNLGKFHFMRAKCLQSIPLM